MISFAANPSDVYDLAKPEPLDLATWLRQRRAPGGSAEPWDGLGYTVYRFDSTGDDTIVYELLRDGRTSLWVISYDAFESQPGGEAIPDIIDSLYGPRREVCVSQNV